MEKYVVTIREVLERKVAVSAETVEKAAEIISEEYRRGAHIMDPCDFATVEFRTENDAGDAHEKNTDSEILIKLSAYESSGVSPEDLMAAVNIFKKSVDGDPDIPAELKSWVERSTWHVKTCRKLRSEMKEMKQSIIKANRLLSPKEDAEAQDEAEILSQLRNILSM